MQITFTIETIKEACKQVWEAGKAYEVWAFYGDMGSGKTTFIHHLCETLGVTSAISSPTYAIINEYESTTTGTIYHMDWYRLKDENEAIEAGVEDCLYSNNLCLVEWAQKAESLLPEKSFQLKIELVDFATRRISFDV
ncbi:MAG TPA: tRNA (adenosine(37)-N6)-threonylcarbamoyltransferase complex ATPase subunit type 1 TsaE [Segetibacter sp.]